jgi:hypothetical protein
MLTLLLTAAFVTAVFSTARQGAAQRADAGRAGAPESGGPPLPVRPVHTYSIVARDPRTGEMGVAVQSHWFSVGSIVSWAEAGVGAVATQSFVDPSYGRNGLELMRGGRAAGDALKSLLERDAGRDVRQVAMVDARPPRISSSPLRP